jgi:hypothetical protein
MSEKTALVVRRPQTPALTPQNWDMIQSVARAAYLSRKFGGTEGEAAIKMLFCYENNLPLTTANTGLYIVNGRMAAMSNIVAAQLRRHPNYDYRVKALDDRGCTIEILRRDPATGEFRVEGEASFTEADAKRANLANKDNYKGFPSDMYFNRALARAQRRYAPDIFNPPVYAPEELGAPLDADGNIIEGVWRVTEPSREEESLAVLLQALVDDFGAEAVLAAGEGTLPATLEEVKAVAVKLMEEGGEPPSTPEEGGE